MASAQALKLRDELQRLKEGVSQESATIDELRESVQMLGSVASEPELAAVERLDVGGCEALRHVPAAGESARAVLWLHGGGYGLLSAETHSRMCGHFANGWGAEVYALDFRRAPEHTFPAALDDALNAYSWLRRKEGYETVVIGGDSAGAGHAVATMLSLEQRGERLPDAAVLISGWYDLNLTYPSLTERFDRDLTNSAELMAVLRDNYLAGLPADDPRVSPIFGELGVLPRVYATVSEEEILYDDTINFVERVQSAGVDIELEIVEIVPHVHTFWAGNVPEADETIRRIGEWL